MIVVRASCSPTERVTHVLFTKRSDAEFMQ